MSEIGKHPLIRTLAALAILLNLSFADYSDVLLVINDNSTDSIGVGNYFAQQRGITHIISVTMPNNSESVKFELFNISLLQPVRAYLNSGNGDGINYIVLSKDIPLRTNESEIDATPGCSVGNHQICQNASSIDTELMLLNSPYEAQISKASYTINPYYNKFARFSRATYGIYLVTRLEAANVSTVYSMIDKSANIRRAERASGLHILTGYLTFQSSQLIVANQTLYRAGLNVLFNSSPNAQYPSNQSNVSYFDTFGCYNFGGCLWFPYYGNPNYTWTNGSIVNVKYSWSARYVNAPHPFESAVVDFLKDGATSGLGYAVEPIGSTTGAPTILATNYVNNFRVAELYWSSVSALSWAGVVFGDPKAGPPSADLNLSPLWPLTPNPPDLRCSGTLIDDLHSKLLVDYQWQRDGKIESKLSGTLETVPTGVYTDFSVLDSRYLQTGDTWSCALQFYTTEGEYLGNASSANATVLSINDNSCRIIDTPNIEYALSANISSNSTCITILAQNVTINCNGHTINGRPAISSSGHHSIVKNCNILSTNDPGIKFANLNNGLIQNTTVNTSGTVGISIVGSKNVTVNNSSSTAFQSSIQARESQVSIANSILNSPSGPAISMQSSNLSSIIGNTLVSPYADALLLDSSSNNIVISNKLVGGPTAIRLTVGSNGNLFLLNNLTGMMAWISNGGENNTFNNSTVGNIYYISNMYYPQNITLASVYYHLVDTTGDSYADAGCKLPLSSVTAPAYWIGNGQDAHPYTHIQCLTAQCIRQLMRTACALDL